MLARFGRDVAGAVVVSSEEPSISAGQVVPYTSDSLARAAAELPDHPLGLYDDSELSLAGLQDKMLLVALPGGQWGRPARGYPSTHILKLDDRMRPGLVRAEHACLQLARAAGLAAASSQLIVIDEVEGIVVERFDRVAPAAGRPDRVHQEDACQALGIDPDAQQRRAKYELYGGPTLRRVATLLESWGESVELTALLEQVTFTVVIGNADAHGKNIALLHPQPGVVRLAPVYDTVPTVLWPRLRTTAALSVGGSVDLPAVTVEDLVREARWWGLTEAVARRQVLDVLERLGAVLSAGDVETATEALTRAQERVRQLLSTRR